jgi:hypothetical protein
MADFNNSWVEIPVCPTSVQLRAAALHFVSMNPKLSYADALKKALLLPEFRECYSLATGQIEIGPSELRDAAIKLCYEKPTLTFGEALTQARAASHRPDFGQYPVDPASIKLRDEAVQLFSESPQLGFGECLRRARAASE